MPEPTSAVSLPVPALRPTARAASAEATGRRLGQLALGCVVLVYLGCVLIAPLGAMAVELTKLGPWTALQSLLEPNALRALRMTLVLTALSVAINAVVGTLGAVAIVRQR